MGWVFSSKCKKMKIAVWAMNQSMVKQWVVWFDEEEELRRELYQEINTQSLRVARTLRLQQHQLIQKFLAVLYHMILFHIIPHYSTFFTFFTLFTFFTFANYIFISPNKCYIFISKKKLWNSENVIFKNTLPWIYQLTFDINMTLIDIYHIYTFFHIFFQNQHKRANVIW